MPLLLTVFGFAALAAVIVNKAMSLVVVAAAIPARLVAVPLFEIADEWAAVANLLAGSLLGAWLGASWATRMATATLYRVLSVLLVFVAMVFTAERIGTIPTADLSEPVQLVAGLVAGFGIGAVAALLGVAGGELLIPTFVLLYGVDTKLAGSLSLLVSLPTMWSRSSGTHASKRSRSCRRTRDSWCRWRLALSPGRLSADCYLAWFRRPCWSRCSPCCSSTRPSRYGVTPHRTVEPSIERALTSLIEHRSRE